MKLNNSNTVVILALGVQMFINCTSKLKDSTVIHVCTIKDLGVHVNWKLHFHAHEDCIFSQYVQMLVLIQTINSSLSTLVDLLIFYVTLVGSSFLPVCKDVGLNSSYNLFLFFTLVNLLVFSITLVGPKLVYLNCMEYCIVCWHQKPGTHSAEVHRPMSK